MNDLYNPNEESTYLQYLDVITFIYGQSFKNYQHMDFYGRRQETLPMKK